MHIMIAFATSITERNTNKIYMCFLIFLGH